MNHARQTAPAWCAMPLVFFALGVCSVMVQAVLVRELLAVFFGSELTLGIVLGSWLVWIAIGAQVGAGLVRWPRAAAWLFFVLAVVGVATAFAQVSVVREARLLLHTPMGEYVPMKAAAKFVALDPKRARGRGVERSDQIHEGRLARAGMAGYGEIFAARHLDVDALQRADHAVTHLVGLDQIMRSDLRRRTRVPHGAISRARSTA